MQQQEKQLVTAIIIGCGQRGKTYASYAHEFPKKMKIMAIAEPRKHTQNHMKQKYKLQDNMVFSDYKEILQNKEKLADIAIIAVQDQMHKEVAIQCAQIGYHLILEKPMAVQLQDCLDIYRECEKNEVILYICHVLRYAPWNKKIKELIETGKIGQIVNINHYEPVGWYHFAHSYVRGNWNKEAESSFSLMTKCCHDIDLISWWAGSKCKSIQSFGNLIHFKRENKPQGSASTCSDCQIEQQCPYSSKKCYDGLNTFTDVMLEEKPDSNSMKDALKGNKYDKCVYECDNDVVDHQIVNFQFQSGTTASFTMSAFTESICERKTFITGTHGEITLQGSVVKLVTFTDKQKGPEEYQSPYCPSRHLIGHDGADFYLMDNFVKNFQNNNWDVLKENGKQALESHILVFKAEESRLKNQVVEI